MIGFLFLGRIVEKTRLASDRELSRIALQVAHDIRSPLGALRVVKEESTKLGEELANILELSIQRIESISEGILHTHRQRLLNLSLNETENILNEPIQLIDLGALLPSIIEEKKWEWRGQWPVIQLGSDLDSPSKEPPRFLVQVQPQLFRRVISNLLNNAREASTHSGTIHLKVQSRENRISLLIIDQGAGMPESVLQRLKRGEHLTTKSQGNGLGLSQARTACRTWGAKLLIESKQGVGTSVSIEFPEVG